MERWLQIQDFPGYSVSDQGRVRNDDTDRVLAMVRNQAGVVMVGLMRGGRQYKRGAARLVADHFLPHDGNDTFTTPMHRDGDRMNNAADNLVLRPKWYAAKYLQQFEQYRPPYVDLPLVEVATGLTFDNSWEATKYFGILEYSIAHSFHEFYANGHDVPAHPTVYRFRRLELV